ncbi:MAG TPA: phage recombination protein Bet [Steroidobacteraceae bacterium]|jgi:phage recombination protein Bet
MNAVAQITAPQLPEPVARRGISEAQWRTLANNLFPGAASDSVLMVWDYCVARRLDPLKKPCHIVPMRVKDAKSGDYFWRDVVMPGIYEYRTTANRTGLYLGHSVPEYGERVDHLGVLAPEYCNFTVYKWNPEAKMRGEYPVQIRFSEVVATAKDKKTNDLYVNDRWSKAPQQMLTKCAEAAALREAFPEELGGTHTVEEMEGQVMLEAVNVTAAGRAPDPRGDLSIVDYTLRDKRFGEIVDILNQDKEEHEIAQHLREYEAEHLMPFHELYMTVQDKLAHENVISKANWRKYLKIGLEPDRGSTHTS